MVDNKALAFNGENDALADLLETTMDFAHDNRALGEGHAMCQCGKSKQQRTQQPEHKSSTIQLV